MPSTERSKAISAIARLIGSGELTAKEGVEAISQLAQEKASEASSASRSSMGDNDPEEDESDPLDDLPANVRVVVQGIAEGEADPYLEIILAAAHGRKNALRNAPGFARSKRKR
jgi:hypothetical protein